MAKEYKITIENNIVGLDKAGNIKNDIASPVRDQNAQAEAVSEKVSKGGSVSKAIAMQMGKQALSYGLSNYGDLTGDHIGQTRINEGLEVAGLIGMAATGWVGAAAALGSVAVKAVNRYVDIKKSEITSNALRIRTGGSRR